MTSGLPLYLVSACATAEEFVAAFRRYADRTGLFIPAAAPLPAGRRGRLALTLKDGGVMIEGEAEILQSSVRPTVLHGRPGMTVKFVDPDEPSKTVIAELEKARLAMKPSPPTVAPRHAAIPESPRPVPPAPSGRIDATNALAECIVIGDVTSLRETGSPARAIPDKFAVPTIPAVGTPRPKTPSTAPAPQPAKPAPAERAKPATVPPDPAATKLPMPASMPKPPPSSRMTTLGLPIVDKSPATESGRAVSNATTLGMPALERKPDVSTLDTKIGTEAPLNPTPPSMPAQKAPPPTTQVTAPTGDEDATTIGSPPIKKPTDPMPAAVPPPPGTPVDLKRLESSKHHKATSIGFPVMRTPFETQPLVLVPPANPLKADAGQNPLPPTLPKSRPAQPPSRNKPPTTPPLGPRQPTPVAPVPIVRSPARSPAPQAPEEEETDLSPLPVATAPTEAMPAVEPVEAPRPAQRSGGMRASEILAAIPAGDWTMTPDESVPHALPSEEKLPAMAAQEPTPVPAPPPVGPSGNWTIANDPESGWTEPEKVAGNPVHAVASDKPINVVQWDEKPTGIGESKIEIDSSLMDTQKRAPSSDDEPARIIDSKPTDDIPPPLAPMPPRAFRASAAPPIPAYPTRSSSTDMLGYGAAAMPPAPANRTKMIALAVGAVAIAIGAIVILVMTLGEAKQPSQAATGPAAPESAESAESAANVAAPAAPAEPTGAAVAEPEESGSAQIAVSPTEGSASETQVAAEPVDAGVAAVEPPEPAQPATCKVQIKSVPAGAEIVIEKKKVGTTPTSIELPCGTETKLALRKRSFPTTTREITPVANKANKLTVKLARTLFSVKVTSTPAGATITAGGKSMGVTPASIKLPAYEAASIKLTKPGYSANTQRVTPKRNNTSHHVTLKKGR